jgi:hypothetical protein
MEEGVVKTGGASCFAGLCGRVYEEEDREAIKHPEGTGSYACHGCRNNTLPSVYHIFCSIFSKQSCWVMCVSMTAVITCAADWFLTNVSLSARYMP